MERRKALATAASVSAVALAATIALGANVGLFGLTTQDNGPGSFQLVDSKSTKPVVRTEIVDIPVTTPDPAGQTTTRPTTPSVSNGGTAGPTVGTTPRADDVDDHKVDDDDHEVDDDSHDSEREHDDEDD